MSVDSQTNFVFNVDSIDLNFIVQKSETPDNPNKPPIALVLMASVNEADIETEADRDNLIDIQTAVGLAIAKFDELDGP